MQIPRSPRAHARRALRRPGAAHAIRPHILLVALTLLAGCAHVAPYEREYLSRPSMDTGQREKAEGRYWSHISEAREGAGGAGQSAGGGCGCN